jgi:hypothetical protein
MENLDIFYDHLVYFTAIGNILWPFGIFCGHLVFFSPFWYIVPRKIWQPWIVGNCLSGTASHFIMVIASNARQFSRVARWYIFKQKIQIWANFGGPWNEKSRYILLPYEIC